MTYHTVPVRANSKYTTHFIVIGVVTVIVMFVASMYLYTKYRHRKLVKHKIGNFKTCIHNKTEYPLTVYLSDEKILLTPGQEYHTHVGFHEGIRAHGRTASSTDLDFTGSYSSETDNIYITEGGIGSTQNTNTNVLFKNITNRDVIFVLVSKYGKSRFPTTVPARTEVSKNTVVKGQRWQVVIPTKPNEVITELVVREVPNSLTFDGGIIHVE